MKENFQDMINEAPPTISRVLVIPKGPNYCRYWLNDSNDIHVKSRKNLLKYLTNLAPSIGEQLSKNINDFYQSFLIIVDPPEIIQLKSPHNIDKPGERSHSEMVGFMNKPKDVTREKNLHPSETTSWIVQQRLQVMRHSENHVNLAEGLPRWGEH